MNHLPVLRPEAVNNRAGPSSSSHPSSPAVSPKSQLQARSKSRSISSDGWKGLPQNGTIARWLLRSLAACAALFVVGYAAHAGLSRALMDCSSSAPSARCHSLESNCLLISSRCSDR